MESNQQYQRIIAVHAPGSPDSPGSSSSSRARHYTEKVRPVLRRLAQQREADFHEIPLNDSPYFDAVAKVANELCDGDIVIGAGGDGTNQVTLQGAFESQKDIRAGFLPLGNANDFARAVNGRASDPETILASPTIDFHPLTLSINGVEIFYVAAYATLGATTVAVDWMNSPEVRKDRAKHPNWPPMRTFLKPSNARAINREINRLDFPGFSRNASAETESEDSTGFFLTRAAGGLLRPSLDAIRSDNDHEFFFHHATIGNINPTIGKMLRSTHWAAKFPGEVSTGETLIFAKPTDLKIHIGGDNVELKDVREINAVRATRAIEIFAPRFSRKRD